PSSTRFGGPFRIARITQRPITAAFATVSLCMDDGLSDQFVDMLRSLVFVPGERAPAACSPLSPDRRPSPPDPRSTAFTKRPSAFTNSPLAFTEKSLESLGNPRFLRWP